LLATSHASHWPPQAVLQHTPSLQWPLLHWFAPLHASPLSYLTVQMPAEQKLVALQFASVVQLPPQIVPAQL